MTSDTRIIDWWWRILPRTEERSLLRLTLSSILDAGSFLDWTVSHTMYVTYARNPTNRLTQIMVAFLRCLLTTVLGSLVARLIDILATAGLIQASVGTRGARSNRDRTSNGRSSARCCSSEKRWTSILPKSVHPTPPAVAFSILRHSRC